MNQSIVLTPHVLNTINALPEEERLTIASALASEMILGANINHGLSPQQALIYGIIKDYVMRDSRRLA